MNHATAQTALMLQKTAVVYAKTGRAVYHSHHDMIRFWERAVRRADLPLRLTQGFNPRPRIIFPHALGLGIASRHEEVELELHARVAKDDLLRRIRLAAGDALEILAAVNLPPVKKSRQLERSDYLVTGWPAAAVPALPAAIAAILGRGDIVVERGAPDNRRRVDIRPYLRELAFEAETGGVRVVLAHTPAGSARPDEVAGEAAELVGADRRDLRIEKTGMELV